MSPIVPDVLLEHVWVRDPELETAEDAGDSENGPARVGPDFYQQNGTPVDFEGQDMHYSHCECEVFGKAMDLLSRAKAHAPPALSFDIGELLNEVARALDAQEAA